MNWKGTLCMLGVVLFCTSLTVSAAPPEQSTAAVQQARVQSLTATFEVVKPQKDPATVKVLPVSQTPTNALAAPGTRGADFVVDAPYEGPTDPMRNTCGAGDDCTMHSGEDHTYEVIIPEDGIWTFSLCGSLFDTYMYVGTTLCGQEVGYNDDYCGLQSQLTAAITAGSYFVDVEGYAAYCGEYVLNVWQEIEPEGACCVGLDCVATNTYLECQALGGAWYENEDCFGDPPFVCPELPDNDLCENAEPVGPPYPQIVYGSNENATIDCPGLLDWYSTWWAIQMPYAENTLYIDFCETPFEITNVGIVIMDDCNCDDYVTYNGIDWYACPSGLTSPTIWWNNIAGPSTWLFPVYFNNGQMAPYALTINVIEVQPCVIECEEGDIIEGEPECYDDYEDTYNGGCNSSPYVFQPIECGQTICGTSGTFYFAGNAYRDTDWFEIITDTPMNFTWTVEAEFEVLIFIIDGGSGNCVDYTIYGSVTGPECTPVTLSTTEGMMPGRYWFWVGPTVFGTGVPCGSTYRATLTCEPFEIRGACCDDDTGDCTDDVLMDDCPPPLRFARDTLCEDLNPPCGGCPEALILIEIMTDPYPTETTWEVTDYYTGAVVGSGGPYDQANTLYTEGVCVPYDGCWNFTIFDSYGDGIYSPGGYSVTYEGELIYSCIGSGWCCTSETVEMFGDNCQYPEGACCIQVEGVWECLYTNTEPECDDLGGRFYVNETCPDFDCPQCEVDFCVAAPYSSPTRNTCGEGNDCALRASEEHEYEVAIPNDGTWTFSLCGSAFDTYLFVGTTICGQEVGYNDDYCGLQSQLTADVTAGLYYVTIEAYGSTQCGDYVLNIWEEVPCSTECPPDGTIEGEPICYDDYEDTYNGGCNSTPFIFQPITCGETICGTSGTFYFGGNSYRDTDWFEIELQADTNVTWTVCASFEALIFIIDGGSGNCVDYTILGQAINGPYLPATLSFDVGPGRYWFWVGPTVFGSGVPCGSEYVGTLTVE
jgi:hypothetical protein